METYQILTSEKKMSSSKNKYECIGMVLGVVIIVVVFSVWGDEILFPGSISISNSGNLEYEYGTTGHNISWTITEKNVGSGREYQITNNDSIIDSGSWSNGTTVNIGVDGLSLGSHTYTLQAIGDDEDPIENSIKVTVIPFIPKIEISTSPSSGYLQYEIGSLGNSISWTIIGREVSSGSYEINRNGSYIDSGGWVNGTTVDINVDGLAIGSYNYTLQATGGTADPKEETILVSVTALLQRIEISSVGGLNYILDTTNNSISWTINGINLDSGSYQITRNGNFVDSGNWNNLTTVSINIDGLSLGSYNYTLLATGGTADPQEKTIVVTVMTDEDYTPYTSDNEIAGYPTIFLLTIGIIVVVFSFRKYKKKSIF